MAVTNEETQAFQHRLIIERCRRSISQTELAEAIGVSQAHLSYIERGIRPLTLARYNKIIGYFSALEAGNKDEPR